MERKQVDKKVTMQVRIDAGWHKILAHLRADTHRSIRSLVEEALMEWQNKHSVGEQL